MMLSRILLVFMVWFAMLGTVQAEVLAAAPGGFKLRVVTTTKADPLTAYDAFTRIGQWWNPAHTYTGDARNMTLDLRPGGAFLEASGSGGWVKHMELVYANPGKEIRLLGGLGPLQPMGIHGAMNVKFEPIESGGTRMVMTYNVSGFSEAGLENLAQVVDRVQTEQMQRHAAYADTQVEG